MARDYSFRSVLSEKDIEDLLFDNESKRKKINKNFLAITIILLVIVLNRILLEPYSYKIAIGITLSLFILGYCLIIKTILLVKKVDDGKKVLCNLMGQEKRFEMVRGYRQSKRKICSFVTKNKLEAIRNKIRKYGVDECISSYRQDLHSLDIMRLRAFMVVLLILIVNLIAKSLDVTTYQNQIPIKIVLTVNVILLIIVLIVIQKIHKQQLQSHAYELALKEEIENVKTVN